MWLNIVAARGQTVVEIVREHWIEFGRNYYSRHDYEEIETEKAESVMQTLRDQLDSLPGTTFGEETVSEAVSFTYHDPVDASVSENQGLMVKFESGSRFVFRLSGTGTVGATLRLYLEKYVSGDEDLHGDLQERLAPIARIAAEITDLNVLTGRDAPSAIS